MAWFGIQHAQLTRMAPLFQQEHVFILVLGHKKWLRQVLFFFFFSTRFPARWVHLLIFSNFVRFLKQLCEISASWFGISETTVWKVEWFQSNLCQKEDLASQLESLRRFGTFYRSHSKLGQFLDFRRICCQTYRWLQIRSMILCSGPGLHLLCEKVKPWNFRNWLEISYFSFFVILWFLIWVTTWQFLEFGACRCHFFTILSLFPKFNSLLQTALFKSLGSAFTIERKPATVCLPFAPFYTLRKKSCILLYNLNNLFFLKMGMACS